LSATFPARSARCSGHVARASGVLVLLHSSNFSLCLPCWREIFEDGARYGRLSFRAVLSPYAAAQSAGLNPETTVH